MDFVILILSILYLCGIHTIGIPLAICCIIEVILLIIKGIITK